MSESNATSSLEARVAALEAALAQKRSGAKQSLSLIVFSGEFDRLYAAFTIAAGAACLDVTVNMFFTFWGASAVCPIIGEKCPKSFAERLFGWLLPNRLDRLPLTRMNWWGLGPRIMRRMMRRRGIEGLEQLIATAQEMGVYFHLCETSSEMMGLSVCHAEGINSCGVSTFITQAMKDDVVLFI